MNIIMLVTIRNEFQTRHATTIPVMVELAVRQTQDMSADVHGVDVLMTWQEPTVKSVRIIFLFKGLNESSVIFSYTSAYQNHQQPMR